MQSSGLLSNLEEGELKSTLATYYEVNFKSIEAANEFFDQVGIVFNNYLPIGLGKSFRASQNLSKDLALNDGDAYQNFMLSLNKTKNILQSRLNVELVNDFGIIPTKLYSLNKDVDFENQKELDNLLLKNENLDFFQYELEYTILKKGLKFVEDKIKTTIVVYPEDKVWAKKVFDKSKAYYHAVSRNSIAELFND
jgi:hypothetical protein